MADKQLFELIKKVAEKYARDVDLGGNAGDPAAALAGSDQLGNVIEAASRIIHSCIHAVDL